MKPALKAKKKKSLELCIEPSLDRKYESVTLFPEKLKNANEDLAKSNFAAFIKKEGL